LEVWTAQQTGGGATVLNPVALGGGGYVINTGVTASYVTNLFLGRAVGGTGRELHPLNAAYHPRIHA